MTPRPIVALARPFARAAVSVLAQLPPRPGAPACLADALWTRHVQGASTASELRERAEERAALARLAPSPEELAMLAWTARLYHDAAHAAEAAEHVTALAQPDALRAVGAFRGASDPRRATWLALSEGLVIAATLHEPAALRAESALDEAAGLSALDDALASRLLVAPGLAGARVEVVPALRLRGRAFPDVLWVGLPSPALELGVEHVAWQAAHEATVREVTNRLVRDRGDRDDRSAAETPRSDHAAVETLALALLAVRVRDARDSPTSADGPYRAGGAPLAASHAAWLAHLAPPWPQRAASLAAAVAAGDADPLAALVAALAPGPPGSLGAPGA